MIEPHRVLRLRESKSVVTRFVLMSYLIRTDRFDFSRMNRQRLNIALIYDRKMQPRLPTVHFTWTCLQHPFYGIHR